MKYQQLPLILLSCTILSCSNKPQKVPAKTTAHSIVAQHSPARQNRGTAHKDTLQFIHFDGNLDYWYVYFLTAKKDTVRMVTDKEFKSKQLDKLFEVKWRLDTLSEAGDNERKYTDKRIVSLKEMKGVPFEPAITGQKVLEDIKNLVEVKDSADRVWIAEEPDIAKPYFAVETATAGENNISRLFSFRVYVFPEYEIKIMDSSNDRELTLAQWRMANQ